MSKVGQKETRELALEGSVERWFNYNLDIASRTIFMGSINSNYGSETGVDNFMAEYFIKGLHTLENISVEPIIVVMNNPGGIWYHGMAIYDAIICSPCKIIIKVYGHAMSMGSIILQAADYRIMMPNSRMMIHYGFSGFSGESKTSSRWANENNRVNYEMEDIYLEAWLNFEKQYGTEKLQEVVSKAVNCVKAIEDPQPPLLDLKLSEDNAEKTKQLRFALRELLNNDTIFSSSEAVELGFADVIYGSQEFMDMIQASVDEQEKEKEKEKEKPKGKKSKKEKEKSKKEKKENEN